MIRVVIDTNVVISATLRSGGLPEAVFNLAVGRRVQLYVSEAILGEYQDVLLRPRLDIHPDKVTIALIRIREAAIPVEPTERVTACSDPDDNIFLECAEAAQADYVVTGNTADFPVQWGKTQIVTPRQFLEIITGGRLE